MPLIQGLIGTSMFRTQLQVAPVRQGFTVTNSNQSVFTTNSLLSGRFTAYGSNVEIFQNGIKLGYQNSNVKDYDIIPYYNGTNTGFQVTLTNSAYFGDYIDVIVFPVYLNDTNLKNQTGYVYQTFYDYWTSSNNNLSWSYGNVGVGTINSSNTLDISGSGAFGSYAGTNTAPANSIIVSGNIGVGTVAPQQQLHVAGNTLIGGNLTASNLYILGGITTINAFDFESSNLFVNNAGTGPAFQVTQQQNIVGAQPVANFLAGTTQALYISSSGNVAIGTTASIRTLNVQGDINFTGSLYQNNNTFTTWGSCNGSLYTIGSSNVGIGMTNPAYSLDVIGTIRASGDIFAYSDRKLKINVMPITNALNTIDILHGVTYNRIDLNGRKGLGLIAQEVNEVLPEVVNYEEKADVMSVAYGNLVGLLIEGIKELRIIVRNQENRIKNLEQQVYQSIN